MRWLFVALLLPACLVPKKKFDALEAELAATKAEMGTAVSDREGKITTLQQALDDAEQKLAALDKQYTTAKADAERAEAAWAKERSDLLADKAGLLKDKSQLNASLQETKDALTDLAARRAAAEERVRQYKDLLGRFKSLIESGRLQVKIVDGKMVVELATDILFDSGKAELSDVGHKAILDVAKVLATIPDRQFQVEGHTDNVPIATDKFPSNWELASARSIVVVRTLIDGGVAPARVSGASYAEFHPVGGNGTAAGRAANRRIEIVVVPDLSLLPGAAELKRAAAE